MQGVAKYGRQEALRLRGDGQVLDPRAHPGGREARSADGPWRRVCCLCRVSRWPHVSSWKEESVLHWEVAVFIAIGVLWKGETTLAGVPSMSFSPSSLPPVVLA